jgi:hypothetical protein
MAKLGVTRVYLQLFDPTDVDHIDLLAARVRPQVPD